jgi:uncharacterized membrane protein YfcA
VSELLLAAAAGFLVAVVCTPVGVSGAVLLLPAQTGVLGLAGPAVSSTNLLFNVVSTPGGLARLSRAALPHRPDVVAVVAVAAPAAVVGALLRVTLLAGAGVFRVLVAAALLPLAATLFWRLAHPSSPAGTGAGRGADESATDTVATLAVLAGLTSLVGAAVGFGGGSLLAPALAVATRRGPRAVAPLALLATLVTSVTGLVAYTLLEALDIGARPAAPSWTVGLALGLGGLAGGLTGARMQPHLPERGLTSLLAVLVTAVAVAQLARG